MRKLILIPEYRPLYGMSKCFGPTHGPLTKPCPTPVDIIGTLLLQTGKEALTIYEVAHDPNNPKVMLPPVRLTLDNYRLPYAEIAGMKEEVPEITMEDNKDESTVIMPEVVEVPETEDVVEPAVEQVETEPEAAVEPEVIIVKDEETVVEETVEEAPEAPAEAEIPYVTTGYVAPVVDTPVDEVAAEITVASTEDNPYAGMTKAERKRARREAREREAAEAAAASESEN